MEWRAFDVSSWHSGYIRVSSYTCAKKQLIYFTKITTQKVLCFILKEEKEKKQNFACKNGYFELTSFLGNVLVLFKLRHNNMLHFNDERQPLSISLNKTFEMVI